MDTIPVFFRSGLPGGQAVSPDRASRQQPRSHFGSGAAFPFFIMQGISGLAFGEAARQKLRRTPSPAAVIPPAASS